MIELYHHGSSVCAAKVRFALGEKKLAWQGHYIDILKGDQFAPEYQKLNPKAVVPTLVHDGNVIVESTVINEYLDETFPDKPLRPSSPVERAEMRVWTKAVDENLHPACGEITFASCHRHIVRRLPEDEFQAFLNSTPTDLGDPPLDERKKEIVMQGLDAPGLDATFRIYDGYLGKMEKALATRYWLTGETFSLADIAMTPYVNRLDMLGMAPMWERKRPHVTDWFNRIKARAAFKPAFLDWCPPDLTADLLNFGRQSWPTVERMLARTG